MGRSIVHPAHAPGGITSMRMGFHRQLHARSKGQPSQWSHLASRLLAMILVAAAARAQCVESWVTPGATDGIAGIAGSVYAITSWDRDGPGGENPVIIAGGRFQTAGNARVNNLALWQEDSNGSGGGTWSDVGGGVAALQNEWFEPVGALVAAPMGALVDGVIVGGVFQEVGLPIKAVPNLARWDGTSWSALGGGVNGPVRALAWLPDGSLAVGGGFVAAGGFGSSVKVNGVARWDGTSWSSLWDQPTAAYVSAMTVTPGGELVIAGGLGSINGAPPATVAMWNGSTWTPLGGIAPGSGSGVLALTWSSTLGIVAGGTFKNFGGSQANAVARWNGNAWVKIGSGLGGDNPSYNDVYALASLSNGNVIAAGFFQDTVGEVKNSVAHWDGSSWRAMGDLQPSGGYGYTIFTSLHAETGQSVIAGGNFTLEDRLSPGGTAVSSIARWRSTDVLGGWSAMGPGTNDWIRASISRSNGDLVVAGDFSSIAGVFSPRVATRRASDGEWVSLGMPAEAWMINALAETPDGTLYAGGTTLVEFTPKPYLARWDPSTGAWVVMSTPAMGANAQSVSRLIALPNGHLVGAYASSTGLIPAALHRWDGTKWNIMAKLAVDIAILPNGSLLAFDGNQVHRWLGFTNKWVEHTLPLAPGTNNFSGWCMSVWPDGQIAVGATFQNGNSQSDGVYRWDGSGWWSVGGGVSFAPGQSAGVSSICALPGGALIVGGAFDLAGAVPVSNLALWDGQQWSDMDGGLSDSGPATITPLQSGEIFVGGSFTRAGEHGAGYFALFGCDCYADCDASGDLTLDDFMCFQTRFAMGEYDADCDRSGDLDITDFICFQSKFAIGC